MDINEAITLADKLIEDAAGTLITPFKIPQFTGVTSTAAAKTELERAKTTRDKTQSTLEIEQERVSKATTEGKEALDMEAIAKASKAIAEAEKAQEIANINKMTDVMLGIDPSSDIGEIAKETRQQRSVARGMLDSLQKVQNVAITDNPLEWLFNQFQLPARIKAYNRQADVVDNLQNTIDQSIKSSQDLSSRYEKGIPTITAKQAKAVADIAFADAKQAKAKADIALSQTNVNFATTKLAEDLAIANATRDTSTLEFQNNKTLYESKLNEIQLTEKRADRQLKAAALLTQLGQTSALDVLLRNFDTTVGNPQGTTHRELFNKLPTKTRENIAAIGAGKGGADPFDFLTNIRDVRMGPNMSKETQSLVLWLNQQAAAQASIVDKMISDNKLTKDQREIKIGAQLNAIIEAQRELAYQPGTLFHEVEPGKLITAGAILPNSLLAKALLPVTQQTGPVAPKMIVDVIHKAFQNNPTITGQVVADYYKRNMKFSNDAMNLQLAGIKPMTSYMVPLDLGFGMSMRFFDLTKSEEATKYVLYQEFTDRIKTIGNVARLLSPEAGITLIKGAASEIKDSIPGIK